MTNQKLWTEGQTNMHSLKYISEELERYYRYINETFKLQLPKDIVITIQSKGRRNAKGWFCLNIWQNNQEEPVHEINMCCEYLKDTPYETLAHEIAHYCEFIEKGTLGKGNYHTKTFKNYAEKLQLKVSKGKHGYDNTEETTEFKQTLKEFKPQEKVFDMLRLSTDRKKAPTKMKKWNCPCTIIRCATQLTAHCKKCDQPFTESI